MIVIAAILLLGYVGARKAGWAAPFAIVWALAALVVLAALAGHGTLNQLYAFARSLV